MASRSKPYADLISITYAFAYFVKMQDEVWITYAVAYASCYYSFMNKDELATALVRLFPSTRKKAKIQAAQRGMSLAKIIDEKF